MDRQQKKQSSTGFITRDFIMACLVAFLCRLALQARNTSTPLYVLALNYTKSAAGLAASAYTIAALVFRPLVGGIIDRFGRKKVLITGTAIIACALVPLSFAKDLPMIYFFSVICGIGFSFQSTALSTIITDLVPDDQLSAGLGYYSLTSTFSQALGPSLALWTIATFSYQGAFLTAAGLVFLGLVCAFLIRYEQKQKAETPAKKDAGTAGGPAEEEGPRPWWAKIVEPGAARSGFMICFVTFASAAIGTFMAAYADENHIANIGMFFTVRAIGTGIARLCTGTVTRAIGNKNTMLVSLVSLVIGYFGIVMCKSIVPLCIISFFYAVGNGLFNVTCNVLAVVQTPKKRRGAANATFYLLMDLGLGVGAAFWGVVADHFGIRGAFLGAGILTAAVLVFAFFYLQKVDIDAPAAG